MNAGAVDATLERHTDEVRSVSFSSVGIRIASGSDAMSVRVRHAFSEGLQNALVGLTSYVTSVSFRSPIGIRVTETLCKPTILFTSVYCTVLREVQSIG